MERENWIETVIKSTDGMTKAVPSSDLFLKIEAKITTVSMVSMKTVCLVAASIVLLFAFNLKLIGTTISKKGNNLQVLEEKLNKSNQLY